MFQINVMDGKIRRGRMIAVANSDRELYFTSFTLYFDSHDSCQPVLGCCFQKIGGSSRSFGVLPKCIAAFTCTRANNIASTSDSDVCLHRCRWKKLVCGTARAKTNIAIHNRLAGPFRPTESCMESLCTSTFDPWLIASDSSAIDPIVCVDRLQRLA